MVSTRNSSAPSPSEWTATNTNAGRPPQASKLRLAPSAWDAHSPSFRNLYPERRSRVDRKLRFLILGRDSIPRKLRYVKAMVSVAPASRRLRTLSWNSGTAGPCCVRASIMSALLQPSAASGRHNSQHVRHELERGFSLKLRHALLLALLCFTHSLNAQTSTQTPGAARPTSPSPSARTPAASAAKPGSLEDKVQQYLRNMYAWGPQFEMKVGPIKPSPIADLLEVPVTVGMQGQSDTAIVYVTKDGKFIVRGELTDMSVDPLAETRSKLHPGTSPSIGPATAKITL